MKLQRRGEFNCVPSVKSNLDIAQSSNPHHVKHQQEVRVCLRHFEAGEAKLIKAGV